MRDWWHERERARESDRARPTDPDRRAERALAERDRQRASMLDCKASDAAYEGTWHMAVQCPRLRVSCFTIQHALSLSLSVSLRLSIPHTLSLSLALIR